MLPQPASVTAASAARSSLRANVVPIQAQSHG
jgi:hypothetical protein